MEKRVFSPHLQTCLISNIKYLISLIHTVSIIHIPFIISLAILSQRLCNTVIHQCVCILYVHCSTNIFNISQKVFSIMLYLVKYTLWCMYHDIGLSCTYFCNLNDTHAVCTVSHRGWYITSSFSFERKLYKFYNKCIQFLFIAHNFTHCTLHIVSQKCFIALEQLNSEHRPQRALNGVQHSYQHWNTGTLEHRARRALNGVLHSYRWCAPLLPRVSPFLCLKGNGHSIHTWWSFLALILQRF